MMMWNISLGFIVCILPLLCTFINPTPLEKGSAGHRSPAPHLEPRDIVTVTQYEGLKSAVQINPPYYNTECKIGGCTFSYEASGAVVSISRHI